ncbi:MAG: TIGR00730 family Rossman fold protein [Sphingomonadales bacterium]
MPSINSVDTIAVFCGSKNGTNPAFATDAIALGHWMAQQNIRLVYGGGSAGLMGVIADAALEKGGQVTGIIPSLLLEWEVQHRKLSELIIVEDMHQRKKELYSRCQAALVLPGGFGTLDELFEIITWNQLTIHDKPIFIINSDGFYDALLLHIEQMKKEGFLYQDAIDRIQVIRTVEELQHYLNIRPRPLFS